MRPAKREDIRRDQIDNESQAKKAAELMFEATVATREQEANLELLWDLIGRAQDAAAAARMQFQLELTPSMGAAYREHRRATEDERRDVATDPYELPAFLRDAAHAA